MTHRIFILMTLVLTSGCSSIDLPKLDMLDSAFRDSATDLEAYPDVEGAPVAPEDMRTAANWDQAARNVLREHEGFDAPEASAMPELTTAEMAALKAKVRAYKLDDPT